MVRVKERYLLVNIIYPPEKAQNGKSGASLPLVQHQPTTESLKPGVLVRAIKAQVASLFGDYGAGAMEGDLSSEFNIQSS